MTFPGATKGGTMRALLSMAAVAVAVTVLAACARPGEQRDDISPDTETTVFVRNDRMLDVTVYLLRGTHRTRLGTVTAHSSRSFVISRELVAGLAELRFLVDPIGDRGIGTSETIVAQPGDVIRVTIRP